MLFVPGPALFGGNVPAITITLDGASNNNVAGSTYIYTVVATIPIGSQVVAGTGTGPVTLSSVADSKGNVWAVDATVSNASGTGAHIASAPVTVALAAADTITFTFSGSTTNHGAAVAYITNQTVASTLDKTATFTGNTSTPIATTAATTFPNEIVIGCVTGPGVTVTEDTNFTAISDATYGAGARRLHVGYRIVAATGTQPYAPTLSGTVQCGESVATYKGL